ncbi:MAG TPA: hypothetical protein VIL74_15050 [Pyrinomonadaceae bacterium]|jgi:hypothetical protein
MPENPHERQDFDDAAEKNDAACGEAPEENGARSDDQRRRRYYYDDAHGYEVYRGEEDDGEKEN